MVKKRRKNPVVSESAESLQKTQTGNILPGLVQIKVMGNFGKTCLKLKLLRIKTWKRRQFIENSISVAMKENGGGTTDGE